MKTAGDQHAFEVELALNGVNPASVQVELYADGMMGSPPVRQQMTCLRARAGTSGCFSYAATVSAARPPSDYTARVIARHDGALVPLECSRILWQR